MTITKTEIQIFEDAVDSWVLEAIACGVRSFDQLVVSLPGVYPSVALKSVQRLVYAKKISSEILANVLKPAKQKLQLPNYSYHQIPLPIPHPLDYDWRFSDASARRLLNECAKVTNLDDTIVLLGTPSLLRMGIEESYSRRLVLLEANHTVTHSLAQVVPQTQVIQCDVMREQLPSLTAAAVVLDPPWYPEHIQSFLWTASQLCQIGGHILLSMPPIGTRPGIQEEWVQILDWTQQIGLTLVKLEQSALSYVTPPFELNVLRAEGLNVVSREWRRGNLAVFLRSHQAEIPRPTISSLDDGWTEEVLLGVRIRVRQPNILEFTDPSLISIIPGDVLQSVSRRDSRRQLADVWTSGNRIFACQGRGVLLQILRAMEIGRSPYEAVAVSVQRPLNLNETELISHAANQIVNIVSTEQKEILLFGEQRNNTQLSLAAG
ncbi:hypothetical protein NIES37_71140 (plasmid) [Tolypothrix tenuis PCC 7101]|uniref:Uncharacterized protein n=1 Tax=Tolypothrix tenuis PCC 7101 TaxID=231146 RepID=A0A1Z4NBJ6_9CYAN|nr:hypothetical protein [Aulosira sp. FACHB-113]BAZ03101.1 hypothetical protein NIES37_71140 [Tolypothrix tenuis PCC 7101]BAZ78627.1 hypothetical protein NIES50_72600 [Aulosira laxa NIES-50]